MIQFARLLAMIGATTAVAWASQAGQAADAVHSYSKSEIAELRQRAVAFMGVLPDKMPGSEHDTEARIALGKRLFFEKRLSVNNKISCNSCHRLDKHLSGTDNLSVSPGALGKTGERNAPTVLDSGFQFAQFWDGRAPDLKTQAKGPILNPIEMAMASEEAVLDRLRKRGSYRRLFRKAFPDENPAITFDNLAEAIAAFERTLITHDRFDDFQRGDDTALSQLELRGFDRFTSIGCTTCHNSPLIGGNVFQKAGLITPYENFSDLGREAVTKNEADRFMFKVPSLRNVGITAPYFHDGGAATLKYAVRKMAWMQLGQQISAQDTEAFVAFLKSLTDKQRVPSQP